MAQWVNLSSREFSSRQLKLKLRCLVKDGIGCLSTNFGSWGTRTVDAQGSTVASVGTVPLFHCSAGATFLFDWGGDYPSKGTRESTTFTCWDLLQKNEMESSQ